MLGLLGESQICGSGDMSLWTDHTAHGAEGDVLSRRDGHQLEEKQNQRGLDGSPWVLPAAHETSVSEKI